MSELYRLAMKCQSKSISDTQDIAAVKFDGISEAGIVVGINKVKGKQKIYCCSDDVHTVIIGATRTGKSRSVVLPTIGMQALAGQNIVCSDPKGELYTYTYPFLKRCGYKVYAIDFKNPKKSDKYNPLQNVIDAVNDGDIPLANKYSFDIVEAMVTESKGEPIWSNGEKAIIAASIIAVVYDNREKPEYQNLTNVYHFICNMCKLGQRMPLDDYIAEMPEEHPARALISASEVAPSRTRGSFYTSALATLRLFSDVYMYKITKESDFRLSEVGQEKTAVFFILPDDNTTYYSIASLFVHQLYTELVKDADKKGGRLDVNVNFNLDEFGNFARISDFSSKLTVGGGRGIRFNLFIQDIGQLEDKYDKNVTRTILGNCLTWIYIHSDDPETNKLVSEKLGDYTCMSNSKSSSYNSPMFGMLHPSNQSESGNLISRKLLTPDEVARVERPYQIVMTRDYPAIMTAPDLSKTVFNKLYGLGNKNYNKKVRIIREQQRTETETENKILLWKIWERYQPSPAAQTVQMFG